MPGLVPGIHVLAALKQERRGWPGRSPAMTKKRIPFKLMITSMPRPRAQHFLAQIVGNLSRDRDEFFVVAQLVDVTRAGQVAGVHRLHARGARGQYRDPVGEPDRLVED